MRADIAVHRVADMESDAEIERRLPLQAAPAVEKAHVRARQVGGIEHAPADLLDLFVPIYPEDAENGVADIFQDIAAVSVKRAGNGLEIVVEDRNQEMEGYAVRQGRETAEVAHPEDGADRVAVTALYGPSIDPAVRLRS